MDELQKALMSGDFEAAKALIDRMIGFSSEYIDYDAGGRRRYRPQKTDKLAERLKQVNDKLSDIIEKTEGADRCLRKITDL